MLTPRRLSQFKRDVRKAEKRGKDMGKLRALLVLPPRGARAVLYRQLGAHAGALPAARLSFSKPLLRTGFQRKGDRETVASPRQRDDRRRAAAFAGGEGDVAAVGACDGAGDGQPEARAAGMTSA